MASLPLGGGRVTKLVGWSIFLNYTLRKRDKVQRYLATLYANDDNKRREAKKRLLNAFIINKEKAARPPYIYSVVTKDGVIKIV